MGLRLSSKEDTVDLDDFIITAFCIIDDILKDIVEDTPFRTRGPKPVLSDSEVITIEAVGEYLSLNQDKAIFDYFRRHYTHLFPALRRLNRTTFVRQSANLCGLKERIWQRILTQVGFDPTLHIIDSFPMPVCQFARAYRCQRFRGQAEFGYDSVSRQTFYGFRIHALVAWPGVIARFAIAPANVHETELVHGLTNGSSGTLLGDRNYWSPRLKEELSAQNIDLLAPFKTKKHDPKPDQNRFLSHCRYRIETVFGQLVDRYHIKRVWAKDMRHLNSRLLRKALSHTLAFMLNQAQGNPPLQISKLLN